MDRDSGPDGDRLRAALAQSARMTRRERRARDRGQPRYTGSAGAPVQALADISLHAAQGELLAVVGPSGCGKTTLLELICGLQDTRRGSDRSAPAALMPQRDLLLPWLSAVDNAALALRIAQCPARAGARAGGAAIRRAGPRGIRAGPPARALRRDAPAGGVRAHAAVGQAGAVSGRAVRRAGRDHACGDAGVAGGRAGAGAENGRAGDA